MSEILDERSSRILCTDVTKLCTSHEKKKRRWTVFTTHAVCYPKCARVKRLKRSYEPIGVS